MKDYIHKIHSCKEKAIIRKDYDVLVIGDGMSGLCVAVASARQGTGTAIVQDRSVFGGNASSEMKMHISDASYHWEKKDATETGILMEPQLENKYLNDSYNCSVWDDVLWSVAMGCEDPDVYMNITMDMMDPDGSCIRYVQCRQMTTENRYEFGAKVFVDATRNGTLRYFVGAEYKIGRKAAVKYGEQDAPEQVDGETMGNTIYFVVEDVGHSMKFTKPGWTYIFTEGNFAHRYHRGIVVHHNADDVVVLRPGEDCRNHEDELVERYDVKSGYWWIELGGDWNNIIEQSEDIRYELYRTVYGMWDHIKDSGDHGAENCELTWVGNLSGMRESRRPMKDYVLTEQDILSNRVSEDAVTYGGWPMNEHVAVGFWAKGQIPSRVRSFKGLYSTPYGCFCSRTVKNLMMAGCDISASKLAAGSTRVIGTCTVGGETVGVVAAGTALSGLTLSEYGKLHRKELQQKLLKDDLYMPGYESEDEDDKARLARLSATSQQSGCGVENLISGATRWKGDQNNLWTPKGIREGGEVVVLELKGPSSISRTRLMFDLNLNEERRISVPRVFMGKEPRSIVKILMEDYRVGALFGGKMATCRDVRDNHQRLNVVEFGETVTVDMVRITFWSTSGCENIQVYEVRIY